MAGQKEKALDLMKQDRLTEALAVVSGLLESCPDDWSLYYLAGQCCRFTERYPEAVRHLRLAAFLSPLEPQIFLALGTAHQLNGEYLPAVKALEAAVRLDPGLSLAYSGLGMTYRRMENYRQALGWYSRAAEILLSLSTAKAGRQHLKSAPTSAEKAPKPRTRNMEQKVFRMLRSTPEYANVLNNMGICHIALGNLDAARDLFQKSIQFIPEGFLFPNPTRNLRLIS